MNYFFRSFKINKKSTLIILLLSVFISCTAQPEPKYLYGLKDKAEFNMLSGKPLSNKYGEVDAIKVVYDIKSAKIYYLNGKNYKYHHGFCSVKLGYNKGLTEFNVNNYSANSDKREYLLGNLNYYHSINEYVMDVSPADMIEPRDIEVLYNKILASTFLGKELKLLLNTSRLINLKDEFHIATITPELIYKNQLYQSISNSKCYGYLRFATIKDLKEKKFNGNDILVLEETPGEIPLVSGVISSEFQTPLSHLSILGRNRDIPIMAYKGAYKNKKLLALKDKYVCLTVTENDYFIRKSSIKNTNAKLNKKNLVLKRDLSVDTLVGFSTLKNVSSASIGNKAKNFAVLQHLSKTTDFKVPEGAFAIPFYFYERHIESSGAGILIEQLLLDIENKQPDIDLKKRLSAIRKSITQAPLDPELIAGITKKESELSNYKRLRFRSSTNAEDMDGFGGAGLYTSKTGIIGDTVKTVERAIKKVWASLWYLRAFNEREYFNIDQKKVAMGILVHRAFPNEIANGVAITKNIYRESHLGHVINVQLGNESVVNPKKGVVCDQVICYETAFANKIYTGKDIVEVITKSSLNNNQLIMTDKEIVHLTKQLETIKKYYYDRDSHRDYAGYGLDIEFKLDTDQRILYIKQVRYYNG